MRLAVFEFGSRGHYASYAEALLEGWQRLRPSSIIQFIVTPEFVTLNPASAAAILAADASVELTVLNDEEQERLSEAQRPDRVPWSWIQEGPETGSRNRTEWDIIQSYGQRFGADHCLAMEIDYLLPALASNLHVTVPLSGIWFKPTFHYGAFGDKSDDKSRLHEKLLVARALANRRLSNLFCLDRFVPPKLSKVGHGHKAVAIADPLPVETTPPRDASRKAIGVEPNRHVLLVFGNISARKGVIEVLLSLGSLARVQQERLCVVVAGVPIEIDEPQLDELLLELKRSGIQVIDRLRHIPEDEVPVLFAASDTVLAVYRNHPGSSGVILRAALHGRPVLAQNYGSMGKLVRDHSLGMTVNALNAEDLAAGIQASLEGAIAKRFDPEAAALLAGRNSRAAFYDPIFRKILPTASR
jgi:glycosyltransferase involved in cell wall biosynthesis